MGWSFLLFKTFVPSSIGGVCCITSSIEGLTMSILHIVVDMIQVLHYNIACNQYKKIPGCSTTFHLNRTSKSIAPKSAHTFVQKANILSTNYILVCKLVVMIITSIHCGSFNHYWLEKATEGITPIGSYSILEFPIKNPLIFITKKLSQKIS